MNGWILQRKDSDDERTLGELFLGRDSFCYTLEPEMGKCIPEGQYPLLLTVSQRATKGELWTPWQEFKLPLVYGVPGFEGIRVHSGNTAKDTIGCILVGMGQTQNAVARSRIALIKMKDQAQFPNTILIKGVI